jgi:hypothetical protein
VGLSSRKSSISKEIVLIFMEPILPNDQWGNNLGSIANKLVINPGKDRDIARRRKHKGVKKPQGLEERQTKILVITSGV